MKIPNVGMFDSDYVEEWKTWIRHQINENLYLNFDQCLLDLVIKSDGRVNSRVVKQIYEEVK